MAFDLGNLAGVAGEILRDTRVVEDPWGFGITATILRFDHPDWKRFELDLAADTPDAQKFRLATADALTADFAPTGFRAAKKLSKAEQHRKMRDQLAEKGELQTDVDALRLRKPGIASILVKKLGGIVENGKAVDLSTPEARLKVLDHRTYEFTDPDGAPQFRAIPVYKRDESGAELADEAGDPIENPHGGMNMGDAVAKWLLEESKDLAGFSVKERSRVLGTSSGMLTGSTASGSLDQSANDE